MGEYQSFRYQLFPIANYCTKYWVLFMHLQEAYKILLVAQEINLPCDLSLPGKPSSKSSIFPFGMTAFCYITNCSYFRLCFEEKASFVDLRRKFFAGQNATGIFLQVRMWQRCLTAVSGEVSRKQVLRSEHSENGYNLLISDHNALAKL